MQYYIVDSQDKASKAILFHDYVHSNYTFHTNSEALQLVFDLAESSLGSSLLTKSDDNTLKVVSFSPDQPLWVKQLLDSICGAGGQWFVSGTGELISSFSIDKFVKEHLF